MVRYGEMSKMTACCGLECTSCPTYLATQNDDNAARAETAMLYFKKFKFNLKPEDINCDGCLTTGGRMIAFCQSCEIRKCCREKGLINCAACKDQPCDTLIKLHEFSPDAKASYEKLLMETGNR